MKKIIISFVFITLFLAGCDSPEKSYENALNSRTQTDFQELIDNYPESKFSDSARTKLIDVNFWSEIDLSLNRIDYETYLDSFPEGLFQQDAKHWLKEINAFESARNIDIIKSYSSFKDTYPSSLYNDSIDTRLKFLEPAYMRFQQLRNKDDIIELFLFVMNFKETGYSKIIQSKLDSIALIQSEETILSQDRYNMLPKSLELLRDYIDTQKDSNMVLLAKQAIEEIIIENIVQVGNGHRFVITDIDIKQNSRDFLLGNRLYYRFLIEESILKNDKKPILIQYNVKSKHGSEEADFYIRQSNSKNELSVILSAYYPYDAFLVEGDIDSYYFDVVLSKSNLSTTLHPGLNKRKHYYDRNVWRFSGEIKAIDGYTIIGDKDDPLSFCLFKDVGAVYLYGKGQVIHDGKITNLGYD